MNNINKIQKKAIKKITTGSRTIEILKSCSIKDNRLITTDLENYLIIDNFTADNHVINADHLIKLNNINNIEINKSKINYITDKKAVNFINKNDVNNFPVLPECEYKFIGELNNNDINNFYSNRCFISKNEMKPSMQFIEIKDNYFNVTDGYKLKRKEITSNFTDKFYITYKAIELLKMLGACDVYMSKEWILYKFIGMELITRNMVDHFPDVSTVIPSEFKGSCTFNKSNFINAINEIKDYSNKENLVKISINGRLELEIKDLESGTGATCEIESNKTGADFTAGYNYKYLLEVLKSYKKDDLIINYNLPTTAIALNNLDNSNLSLLMPIRL